MLKKRGQLIALSIGNALEFYDFAIYGFLISVLSKLFFPPYDLRVQLILSTTVFTIGFIARPIGGLIFGYIGDHYGRKKSLEYSIIAMGVFTCCIGILPTYAQVGVLAPVLLSCLRVMQGVIIGGEFTTSIVYLSEHELFRSRPILYIAINSSLGVSGWFLGILVVYFCEQYFVSDLSWRVPFFLGGFLSVVGIYIRKKFKEDTAVSFSITSNINSSLNISKGDVRNLFIIALVAAVTCSVFYGQFIYQNVYLVSVLKLQKSMAKIATGGGIFSYMVFLPIMGYIASKVCYIKMVRLFTVLLCLLNYLVFNLIDSGHFIYIFLSMQLSAFLLAGFFAPASYFMTKLFATERRCTNVSIAYNVGGSVLGGSVPTLYILYTEYFGTEYLFVYLSTLSVVLLILIRSR